MRRARCASSPPFATGALAILAAMGLLSISTRADAQACCAGSGALTPGRLTMHDSALAGVQLRAAGILGSFAPSTHYTASPPGTSEYDFEQDLFGAIRLFQHGEVALLLPLVETARRTPTSPSELGGGIGDINVSGRYDFYAAGRSRFVPGIALLVGATFPTGTAPEAASKPLATDATGTGAYQGSAGVAVEQSYGAWLLNATALLALRGTRSVGPIRETLGPQFTAFLATAYSFPNDAALALSASYSLEADAVIDDALVPESARSVATLSVSGVWPISDQLRLQSALFINPPISNFGRNLPATAGGTFAFVYAFR